MKLFILKVILIKAQGWPSLCFSKTLNERKAPTSCAQTITLMRATLRAWKQKWKPPKQ